MGWKSNTPSCLELTINNVPAFVMDELEREAHEDTLDAIWQFDYLTGLGFKLNFLTGEFE